MKRLRIKCFPLLAVMALNVLAGCQAPVLGELSSVWCGQKVTTSLSVAPLRDPNRTKSTYTGDEDAVRNWNLLVFENGVLKAKYYKGSGKNITLEVMTDRPYRYYAVANVGDIRSQVVKYNTESPSQVVLERADFWPDSLLWGPDQVSYLIDLEV